MNSVRGVDVTVVLSGVCAYNEVKKRELGKKRVSGECHVFLDHFVLQWWYSISRVGYHPTPAAYSIHITFALGLLTRRQ